MGLGKSISFLPYTVGSYVPVSRSKFLPPLRPAIGACPKKLVTQASAIILPDFSKAFVKKDAVKDGIKLPTCELNMVTPGWAMTWLMGLQ